MNMEEYQFQQFVKESLIDINGKIIQLKKDVDELKKKQQVNLRPKLLIASCPQFYRIFEFLSLGNQAFAFFTSNYKKLRSM